MLSEPLFLIKEENRKTVGKKKRERERERANTALRTKTDAWHAGIIGDDSQILEALALGHGIDEGVWDTREAEAADEYGRAALDIFEGFGGRGAQLVDPAQCSRGREASRCFQRSKPGRRATRKP